MSKPVRIAILDSGVAVNHAHISRPVSGGVTITSDGISEGYADMLGHGTAVCALIQAMAPEAQVFSVKVFDRRLATTASIVMRAIEWCLENSMDIVNLSLGTANSDHRQQFAAVVDRVCVAGAVLVSAYEVNDTLMLPGSMRGVVGVVEDTACEREEVRVLPGDPRRVTACPYPLDIAGVPRERNLRGVSFSVAHVSARLACLRANDARTPWEELLRGASVATAV
ncbi:S8 family serine peptidase [Terriglobus roseus]|uniref:Subtilase family protein n=1 Tax=Terriglobus roseus TaxID=392734 RepID=A0A1G7HZ62_9BACT|nr:S8 family serine peptidase [Terriglobus roseus]SDF05791.1 Subtilase family protein [Terriglobus roseus]